MTVLAATAYPSRADLPAVAEQHPTANPAAVEFVQGFFAAKSSLDLDATMAYISHDLETYTDATLYWDNEGYDVIHAVWSQYMPNWAAGLSYPTRIAGDLVAGNGSLAICFTDTPELFGGELRITGIVDVRDGQIVRWIDYWDSAWMPATVYDQLKQPAQDVPVALRSKQPDTTAGVADGARKLMAGLAAGDAAAAANAFAYDGVVEDHALGLRLAGRVAIASFLSRAVAELPYGSGAELGHIVGSSRNGGFEWGRRDDAAVRCGTALLDLDHEGLVSNAAFVYDSRPLGDAARLSLAGLALERFDSAP